MHDKSKVKSRMISVNVSLLKVSFSPTIYFEVLCKSTTRTNIVAVISVKSMSYITLPIYTTVFEIISTLSSYVFPTPSAIKTAIMVKTKQVLKVDATIRPIVIILSRD